MNIVTRTLIDRPSDKEFGLVRVILTVFQNKNIALVDLDEFVIVARDFEVQLAVVYIFLYMRERFQPEFSRAFNGIDRVANNIRYHVAFNQEGK